ncbi:DNA-binding transcriptional regulator Fis [uncultured Umboniibacter sp.]|uniref:DNA-binding transcriptional regulator Fis n=1 Tax=uncultured Umboniibacter sp. TaxID=1798917 RepID=UPI002622E051|nr:DNA-binding transcriptional regulator Fis [uncultured Umboniibacter sp.]
MSEQLLKATEANVEDYPTLRDSVARSMRNYFKALEGQEPSEIYDMVMNEVEEPLLEAVMKFTKNNQSRAASIMGLNRGTLRKKLKRYDML